MIRSDTTKDYRGYEGTRFGKLTIQTVFRDTKGVLRCSCQCDCGNQTEAYLNNIRSGRTKSCGCGERANRKKFQDLTGQRFGKLIALSPTEKRQDKGVVWRCQCDCGNIYEQTQRNLVRGYSWHCGCEKKCRPPMQMKDLTNQKFNRLRALSPTGERTAGGSVIWQCICDCGQEAKVSETALVHGSQISCGCRLQEVGRELSHHLHFVDGTCLEFLRRKQRCDNSSGYPGVYQTENGKYKAGITFKKTRYYLGTYPTFEEAKRERQQAEQRYHQSFLKEQGSVLQQR